MTSRRAPLEQVRARRSLLQGMVCAVAAAASLACSAMLEREHDQCRTSEDCLRFGTGAVCTTSGTCQRVSRPEPPPGSTALRPCQADDDCAVAAVCRRGTCTDLELPGCRTLSAPGPDSSAERLPLAVLLPATDRDATLIRDAIQIALNGWSEVRGIAPELPELLIATCAANDSAAVEFLSELGLGLIIAATKSVELESVIEEVRGRAVIFAPFAEAPGLRELVESGNTSSVVSCKSSPADRIASLGAAITAMRSALEQRNRIAPDGATVVALSGNEIRYGYDALLDGAAIDETISVVTYGTTVSGSGLVAALADSELHPGLVVGISGEADWSSNIDAIESSSFGLTEPPPSYLLTEQQSGVRELVSHRRTEANGTLRQPKPLSERVVVLHQFANDRNRVVHDQFADELLANDVASSPDLDYLHDCFYVAGYAALAARLRFAFTPDQLTPESVLAGLQSLVGGKPVSVGARGLADGQAVLAASHGSAGALDLVGGSGDLDFVDLPTVTQVQRSPATHYVAPTASDSEFTCVDAAENKYCETGVVVSQYGEISGINQCPCFKL
jgi:hypothetical protein